ncbi:hypothetical protein DY000_02059815 [Brassica cretica]|uniref:Secreted protein n=1 Tax=Brassica cretica TaxID=69181 RepID=A0ABQ7APZ1_BRACR|nr:hypothetical protein DY000_02059815 [Brassica cretica]
MVSPLLLVQIWLSRHRSRRLSVLWATLEDSDGSSLLSPLVWSLILHPPSVWRVIVVEVGSLFGSRVGAVYAPVSCSSFFPPVVSGGLHIFKVGWLLVSPHSCLKWFSSALRFEALSCWRCGAQRPIILSMCCIAGLFAPKWAVVVF